jgi:Calcineurin-like phosphoesterase/Purple acid Phosphatase, N-terminal domain
MANQGLKPNRATISWKRRRLTLRLLVFLIPMLATALTAADSTPTNRGTNAPSASRDVDPDAPPAQVEDDRAREEAADRASRRSFSELLRGPYLQMGTTNSMVVRWRTDRPARSTVRFGLSETNLRFTARSRGMHTDHVVVLTNLSPATRYFYALSTNTISSTNTLRRTNDANGATGQRRGSGRGERGSGSGTNLASRATNDVSRTNIVMIGTNRVSGTNIILAVTTNSFITAPLIGKTQPMRVWVLGDSGTRQPTQKAVKDGFYKFNGDRWIDLWLMLGDNAYQSGTDTEYQGSVFLAYPELLRRSVLWPSLGNHDGDQTTSPAQAGEYYDMFTLPTQGQAGGVMSGTEAYYSFDYANVHFICIDSYDSDRSTNGLMVRWLKADVTANRQQWSVAYWHHPPYSKGGHDSDDDKDGESRSREMRENILPVLENGGVDLVLCGHSHTYERTPLISGHYGRSTNFSTTFIKNAGDGCEETGDSYRKTTIGPGPNEGTVYVVAGSSGQTSGAKGVHPAMLYTLSVAGSLALDFDGPRLEVSFVDTNGWRRDHFTMLKGPLPSTIVHDYGSNAIPANTVSLPLSPLAPAKLSSLCELPSSERETLLGLYRTTTNITFKTALTWTLAGMADPRIAAELSAAVTNKIHDRTISAEEEMLKLASVRALGLVASRYEPVTETIRKGLSADWWYFRTNYVSTRPQELSAADLQSAAIDALVLTARPELQRMLARARKSYKEFTFGDDLKVFRNYASEFDRASNTLVRASQMDPYLWRHRVVAEELEKLSAK